MIGFVSKIKNLTIQSLNIVISSFTLCSQPFGLIFQYTILESLNGVTYSSPPRLSCTRRKFKAATPNTHFGIVYVATPNKTNQEQLFSSSKHFSRNWFVVKQIAAWQVMMNFRPMSSKTQVCSWRPFQWKGWSVFFRHIFHMLFVVCHSVNKIVNNCVNEMMVFYHWSS